ncbi:MAG: hypothetical protein JJU07_06975, partial [Natronohydrobacter sp.]|nr:hypothetical protein [Natronohydrobacter sp.]
MPFRLSRLPALISATAILWLILIQPNHPAAMTWGALRMFPLELPALLAALILAGPGAAGRAFRALLVAAGPRLAAALAPGAAADARLTDDPAPPEGADLMGAWMRRLLRAGPPSRPCPAPSDIPRAQIEAAAEARAVLDGLPLPDGVPDTAALVRSRDLAQLLDPFALLTGHEADGDRFAGREAELTHLRAFVDVLPADSWTEAYGRAGRRLWSRLAGTGPGDPRLMTIAGGGGLGKSTLMARFVFDHAVKGAERLPFAYLDFDRAGLQPRQPGTLLLEAARQVALQFPEAKPALDRLRADLRNHLAGRMAGGEAAGYQTFRRTVAEILAAHHARTFLLVLDTTEQVEADPAAAEGTIAFVIRLASSRQGPMPGLCVVASGRAGFADLAAATGRVLRVESMTLGPLPAVEAAALAERLGRRLLGADWDAGWARALAGGRGWRGAGRDPLTLQTAVQAVARAEPDARAGLVRRIARQGATADPAFIQALVEARTLDHLDPTLRSLARLMLPSGVVSRAMALEVLAPLAGLAPDAAGAAFDRLAGTAWFGTLHDRPEPRTLHLDTALRSRLVPALQADDTGAVAATLDAAIDWTATRPAWRQERLALRLMRGDPEDLAADPPPPAELRGLAALRRYLPAGSAGRLWLEAGIASAPIPAAGLRALPDGPAWDHVARAGGSLRGLDLGRIDARTQAMAERPPPADPAAHEAWAALLIRAGRWQPLCAAPTLPIPELPDDLSSLAWWLGRVIAPWPEALAARLERQPDLPDRLAEAAMASGWTPAALALPFLQVTRPKAAAALDRMLADRSLAHAALRRIDVLALRSALAAGVSAAGPAARAWLAAEHERILSAGQLPDGFAAALGLKAVPDPEAAAMALDRLREELTGGPAPDAVRALARLTAPGWIAPAGHAAARQGEPGARGVLDRIFGGPAPRDAMAMLDAADAAGRFDRALAPLAPGDPDLELIRAARHRWVVNGQATVSQAMPT